MGEQPNPRDLSDFVQLFTENNGESKILLYDFSCVVQYFHDEIDKKLKQRENNELLVKKATVFNNWTRLKSLTNEALLSQTVSLVIRDSEEVLNWIYTRLLELNQKYKYANDSSNNYRNEKTESLLKLSDEIEAFIEMLLCNIHSTLKVDIGYFKSETVVIQHCYSIRNIVFHALCNEIGFHNGNFRWNSLIYQSCMEDLGINPEALLYQVGSDRKASDIKNEIISNPEIVDMSDEYDSKRGFIVTWTNTSKGSIDRTKILLQLLQKIDSIILLIDTLKSHDVIFDISSENREKFELSFESLLLENRT
jgi:hypothetical protein